MTVENTLENRNGCHGDYPQQAATAEALKNVMKAGKFWKMMTPVQRESLDIIAVKISRILTGNPNHADHWHDIQGYARLAEREVVNAQPLPEKINVR